MSGEHIVTLVAIFIAGLLVVGSVLASHRARERRRAESAKSFERLRKQHEDHVHFGVGLQDMKQALVRRDLRLTIMLAPYGGPIHRPLVKRVEAFSRTAPYEPISLGSKPGAPWVIPRD